MKKRNILIIILIVVVTGAAWLYYYVNRPVQDASGFEPDFKMPAHELLNAYEQDEAKADSMFLGKIIEVQGAVTSIDSASSTVSVAAGSEMSCVSCEIASDFVHRLPELKPGDSVIVKGECAGYLMDVVLKQSIIEKK
jgi:tRNA_anti-like